MTESRRIAVIGSNSFSGSDLIDLLLEDEANQIIGISRSPEKSGAFLPYKRHQRERFRFYRLDLNKDSGAIIDLLDGFEPQLIVNFAAQSEVGPSWDHPEDWFETNVVSLARLIGVLKSRRYLQRYVHISSPEVYGNCEGNVSESAPLNPSTPYAVSKAAADLLLTSFVKNFDFPLVTIRATNVYGAHQQLWKLMPRTVINLRTGKKIPLDGGGVAVKSYIHVRDVSRGEMSAMYLGKPGMIYHLSPDHGYSVTDVVRTICDAMGCDFASSTVLAEERLGQDAAYVIDSTRAREEFGWLPEISLSHGIETLIDWVESNWDEILRHPMVYEHKP